MSIAAEKKMMDLMEYLVLSEVTEKKFPEGMSLTQEQAEILHAAMGLVTEAGEIMDAVKKHLIYGKPFDWTNLNEELGDQYWYLAIAHRHLLRKQGVLPSDTMVTNIDKLKERYPEGYKDADALVRNLEAERQILEDGLNGNS